MAQTSTQRERTAPAPDDARKPDDPTDVTKRSWMYILKKTLREFGADQCTDLAAALTYYAVLALFPGLLAIVSILGLFGQAETTTNAVLDIAGGLVSTDMLDTIRGPVQELTSSSAAGITFVTGLLGALWSASGYVGGFGRAMNRIYEIDEGRPIWKLRPTMLAITVTTVLLLVIAGLLLVVSGPIAETIGDAIGLGEVALTVWGIIKWPLLVAIMIVIIAVLYHWSPNVKQPKFRWSSLGSILALIVWALASLGFGLYVANFANYDKTYGALGGVIVFLLWLWITNLALLFGAEFDAELERGRQLQAGIKAEETLQLPPRDTRLSEKKAKKHEEDVADGRKLRQTAGGSDDGSADQHTPSEEKK